MARRLLITLCLAALGAMAWWILHTREQPDEGLVVHVRVQDAAGRPLPGAQVQGVYTPGWREVDASGRRRLTRVLLRADEAPSAEALQAAIQVRARFYTLPRGAEPAVKRLSQDEWELRFALQNHGVFRLSVEDTHLGPVKAFLEPDPEGRWEAMDRGNVARPGSPAAYRIYAGLTRLTVRLEGEPDKDGAIAAATRRWTIDAPAPGSLLERSFTADEVLPIIGSLTAPADGPQPPTLRGRVAVAGIAADGTRTEYGAVRVDDAGTFIVRRMGKGTYELTPTCDCVSGFEPQRVEAGDVVALAGAAVEPWLVVEHVGLSNARDRNATFALQAAADAGAPTIGHPLLFAHEKTTVSVPAGSGNRLQLVVRAPGTDTEPPLIGAGEARLEQPGANPVRIEMKTSTLR